MPADRSAQYPADASRTRISNPPFKVACLGASAGGLAALKTFFAHLQSESGIAFVVVVHLSPERESVLAQLLQAKCRIPVEQVQNTIELHPNHVYVIPPGHNISTIDSHLRLSDLESQRNKRAPIDHFMTTLAKSHREAAIGVVLSGTGSDGTAGLGRIKAEGGLCLVQDPNEADYDGMPQSAIATGIVDLAMPVSEIAAYLAGVGHVNPQVPLPGDGEELSPEVLSLLRKVFSEVSQHRGNEFDRYKRSTVLRRIRRRMQLHQITDLNDYLQLLREQKREVQALFEDLLITVTHFFRDAAVFEAFEKKILSRLFEGKGPSDSVRAWIVGCASGEEAYTVAMLLHEYAATLKQAPTIQIFASDLHEKSLLRAREGIYSPSIEANVSPERLERHFTQTEEGSYVIRPEIRESVLFAPHNFLRDPPFSHLDMIACRNVLIYLQREVQQDILNVFHYALNPGGFLLLGTSETVEKTEAFRPCLKQHSIFIRHNVKISIRMPPFPLAASQGRPRPSRDRRLGSPGYGALHEQAVERYAPPSVLVNPEFDIVHYSQHAGRFFSQPGGEPTNNVFKRVCEELRIELRAALYSVQDSGKATMTRPVPTQVGSETIPVTLRVQTTQGDECDGYFLVFFEESPLSSPTYEHSTREGSVHERELEAELKLTKNRLQAVIEEYEATQEEMQASNEELQSTNEELRSAMEELETGKEELQSMNEELTTVNQENKNKVDELSQMTGDLHNLLASIQIATLFLDRNLRILRFTPRVTELFNIRQSDRGRPLMDFTHRLGYEALLEDAKLVFENLQQVESEVQARDGTWYLMRILPYRTVEDRIEGVVITLVDVSALKAAENGLREREAELKALAASLEQRVVERTRQVQALASRLTRAEQEERNRIAHILHDDLQQMLVSVQMRLQILFEQNKLEKEDADGLQRDLSSAIEVSRNLTVDLSPPILKHEDLPAAMAWLRSQLAKRHQFELLIDVAPDLPLLDTATRMMVFQVVRELLFNVIKHAQVDTATVKLSRSDKDRLHIEVCDHGIGFDPATMEDGKKDSTRFGLLQAREQLELYEGTLRLESAPGKGCCAYIDVPTTTHAESSQRPLHST